MIHYAPSSRPPQGRWRIYGIGLPDSILKKVYSGNAARLLGWGEGEWGRPPGLRGFFRTRSLASDARRGRGRRAERAHLVERGHAGVAGERGQQRAIRSSGRLVTR